MLKQKLERATIVLVVMILTTFIYSRLTSNTITTDSMINYCQINTTTKATKFYSKKLDNYYFYISVDGSSNKSDELYIFKGRSRFLHRVEYFGGSSPEENAHRESYSWYRTTFTDKHGRSIGEKQIFYSSNREHIAKAVITIKEEGKSSQEKYKLNPEEPFILPIQNLGTTHNRAREITDYHFYDETGKEVPETAN